LLLHLPIISENPTDIPEVWFTNSVGIFQPNQFGNQDRSS
jgi:hypothetical protein